MFSILSVPSHQFLVCQNNWIYRYFVNCILILIISNFFFEEMGKRKCKFNDQLKKEFKSFKQCDDDYNVKCTVCNIIINISNKGRISLLKHCESKIHKDNLRSISNNTKLTTWTVCSDVNRVSARELTLAYHTAYHNFSFLSSECTNELLPLLFDDSHIAKKISSKRTKTEALIRGVIGPFGLQKTLDEVKDTLYISVITDCSNHKSIKLLPIIIQFFCKEKGFVNRIVDLVTLCDEKSETIFENITKTLVKFDLEKKCIGFGADNCPINFGSFQHRGNNNVFSRLRFFNENMQGV